MLKALRRRLEMAERVRDFLRAHQTDGVGEGLGLAKLEQLLQRAEALAEQQKLGMAMTRSATKHRREVRKALLRKILRYVRVVGAVAAKQKGELGNRFPLPNENTSQKDLVASGRATLDTATAQKDVLVGLGMAPQVLDMLTAALDEFEQTLAATREGRREHAGASAELQTIGAEISEQVRLLDGVVQFRFGDNPELMGAWASARNVLGPFKPKTETPGADGSETLRTAQGRPPKAA
jgi:hypothetical protein